MQVVDYLERNLRRFMRPTGRHTAWHMRSGANRIEYQPLGVVGVVSPWNYPVNLSLMPVVTAIAAGNRVMLKPSKFTPATNTVLASILSELFPPEQVTIVSGDGAAFSSLPFDHLVFTGSTEVGRAVMKAACGRAACACRARWSDSGSRGSITGGFRHQVQARRVQATKAVASKRRH
ncbi:aldehyde dehydrogenase family protein [Streptomyces coeruleorubidus]|uniref:aldehyde dehydrogenase family protein n=1 Tax=Streptomyces coeruleorubidus TaxID=116188 RepID=UPI003410F0DC